MIGPTGKPFTDDSIGMALATRDLLTDLRSAGATTRGPPPLTRQDISRFLSALDLAVVRSAVMAGLDPAIHVLLATMEKGVRRGCPAQGRE